ncbi:MAG: DUF3343 domain-containing protein [Clostridiales bacterium]|jgi:hypothetical protein|nr:DUF3343 domain-containing protein [Clostridiales bacterium]
MLQYLLMCRSLTYAQRASRALERIGITAIITKAPKSVTGQGCNYCVKVSERNLVKSLSTLKEAGLGPSRVFLVSHDGSVSEVPG